MIAVVFVVSLLPFYAMLINATRTTSEINRGLALLPSDALARNWVSLTSRVDILAGLRNSLFVVSSAVVVSSYVSALCAFGFAFYRFRGRTVLFILVIAMMMIPPQIGIIGLYDFARILGLLDTYTILIVPFVANPLFVFFLRQYTRSVMPRALIDAALMDGAGNLRMFHSIALPLMMPGIATMAIFAFVAIWNNYILPLVVTFSSDRYVLPLIIASLNTTTHRRDFGAIYLAVAVSVVPVLIVFVFLQRYLIQGVTVGGVQGE